jgi:hypothetical protein
MRAKPWTASTKTRLGATTSRQIFLGLLTVAIGLGPTLIFIFGMTPGWLSPARRAFELASVLALLTSYPAFATFRSMIPGSMGDIGNGPPYDVAARGAGFLLLGLGLLLASLVVGGHLGNTELSEWRASVQRGQHLTAAGTLVRLTIRTVERTAFRNVWLDEHVVFELSSGKQFEVVCTRRARDVAAADRPFSCLESIQDHAEL